MTSTKETREFQVDGTDGIYVDKQAEDGMEKEMAEDAIKAEGS